MPNAKPETECCTERLVVLLPPSLWLATERAARLCNVSKSAWVRNALLEQIERDTFRHAERRQRLPGWVG